MVRAIASAMPANQSELLRRLALPWRNTTGESFRPCVTIGVTVRRRALRNKWPFVARASHRSAAMNDNEPMVDELGERGSTYALTDAGKAVDVSCEKIGHRAHEPAGAFANESRDGWLITATGYRNGPAGP